MNQIIPIAIMSIKVAIPTILVIIGINLLIVSHSKWESLMGKLVGVNDLEVSKSAFVVMKIVAVLMILGAGGLSWFLFMSGK